MTAPSSTPAVPGCVSPTPSSRTVRLLLLALIVAAPAWFTLRSGNIWEDFFITYRCSLNLVHGEGLTYEAGTRVHTFTSPLGTLLPALLAWGAGTDDSAVVLGWFRVLGCLALAAAWWLAAPGFRSAAGLAAAALFWALDVKIAAFSTNGMETAWLLLAVVLAWRALVDRRPVLAGVALGFALWTRPDGFIFVMALAIAVLVIPGGVRWRLRDWLVMAGVAAAIYTPWFAWAWSYYGSPVPNTVAAKATHLTLAESLRILAAYPFQFLFTHSAAHDAFLPPYFFFGPWPAWLPWFGHGVALLAAGVACWPACSRPSRVAGLGFVLGGIYLTITTRAPWYFPAWALLAYLALAGGLEKAWRRWRPRWRAVALGGAAVLLAAQGWLFFAVTQQLRWQQELIEWDVRARIGRQLRNSSASPSETVFLEPLGYIGFFSGLAMRDTPGLGAPEVVRLRKAGTLAMGKLIAAVQPHWAVLRDVELAGMTAEERARLETDYFLAATHDARDRINAVSWLPGREFLLFDAYYTVWRRRSTPGAP